MKTSLLKTIFASGLLLTTSLAIAQASEAVPPAKKSVHSKAAPRRAKAVKAKPAAGEVDINRASKDDLKKLPGITDALADKIIAHRPYLSKAAVVDVVSMGIYQGIRDKIVAGYQSPAKKP
jgi:DNA uptake protein ComE-like DNA-binding protein